jgi:hypothetical protein
MGSEPVVISAFIRNLLPLVQKNGKRNVSISDWASAQVNGAL